MSGPIRMNSLLPKLACMESGRTISTVPFVPLSSNDMRNDVAVVSAFPEDRTSAGTASARAADGSKSAAAAATETQCARMRAACPRHYRAPSMGRRSGLHAKRTLRRQAHLTMFLLAALGPLPDELADKPKHAANTKREHFPTAQ